MRGGGKGVRLRRGGGETERRGEEERLGGGEGVRKKGTKGWER